MSGAEPGEACQPTSCLDDSAPLQGSCTKTGFWFLSGLHNGVGSEWAYWEHLHVAVLGVSWCKGLWCVCVGHASLIWRLYEGILPRRWADKNCCQSMVRSEELIQITRTPAHVWNCHTCWGETRLSVCSASCAR